MTESLQQNPYAAWAIFATIVMFALWGFLVAAKRVRLAQRSRERAFADDDQIALPNDDTESVWRGGWLSQWLARAGFRSRRAAPLFLFVTILSAGAGAGFALAINVSGVIESSILELQEIPGGFGEMFVPILNLLPWFLVLLLAALPLLLVRRARARRASLIEQDLSPTLNLLATMAESGLGFDAALSQILATRLGRRPLAMEFRSYQTDLLAGRSRVQALRRLSHRADVTSVTIFSSAMAQAEQIGMGIAAILRRQADDLRDRRRERATAFAMSLAVKRIIPLVVCFLPGLFVWTLGPFFVQFFQLADTLIQVRDF